MENLTNEQIIDIINFYKLCGISEDMYLSKNGVLDLFTLLGIKPEYDEYGNRQLTVYEQLSIAPMFRDGKEVPIVFAIKNKVSKIHKNKPVTDNKLKEGLKFGTVKEAGNDKVILGKLKKDYFSAFSNGNLIEATRLYDMIDMLTGGKADDFIGIQYNAIKFYKKMQQQLLIDMFANFVILMILSKSSSIKEGIVKFDKLYKSFVEHELSAGGLGATIVSSRAPKISNITVSIASENETPKKVTISAGVKKDGKSETIKVQENVNPEQSQENIVSFIKSKVNVKINKIKEKLDEKLLGKDGFDSKRQRNSINSDRTLNMLEND